MDRTLRTVVTDESQDVVGISREVVKGQESLPNGVEGLDAMLSVSHIFSFQSHMWYPIYCI